MPREEYFLPLRHLEKTEAAKILVRSRFDPASDSAGSMKARYIDSDNTTDQQVLAARGIYGRASNDDTTLKHMAYLSAIVLQDMCRRIDPTAIFAIPEIPGNLSVAFV